MTAEELIARLRYVAELRDRVHAAALQAQAADDSDCVLVARGFIEQASKRLDPETLTDGAILWAEKELADGLQYLAAAGG